MWAPRCLLDNATLAAAMTIAFRAQSNGATCALRLPSGQAHTAKQNALYLCHRNAMQLQQGSGAAQAHALAADQACPATIRHPCAALDWVGARGACKQHLQLVLKGGALRVRGGGLATSRPPLQSSSSHGKASRAGSAAPLNTLLPASKQLSNRTHEPHKKAAHLLRTTGVVCAARVYAGRCGGLSGAQHAQHVPMPAGASKRRARLQGVSTGVKPELKD